MFTEGYIITLSKLEYLHRERFAISPHHFLVEALGPIDGGDIGWEGGYC